MKRLLILATLLMAVVTGVRGDSISNVGGTVNQSVLTPFTCSIDAVGATLTECQAIPQPGKRYVITDIVAQSTTGTGGQFLIRTGTGTNCGSNTLSLLPSSATVVRIAYPGNSAHPCRLQFNTPLYAPADRAICVLGVATNLVTMQITGYIL